MTVEHSPDNPAPIDQIRAEVAAETSDGYVTVTLVTEVDEADIRVPPLDKWRSSARHALFTQGDDLAWAIATLSADDAQAWTELDPTKEESTDFFTRWGEATGAGLGNSRRERRQSQRSHPKSKAI